MFERDQNSIVSESIGRLNLFVRQVNWPTLVSGLAMGLVVMQLLVGRSVNRRMDELNVQMQQTQKQMSLLAGSIDDVSQANDLLTRLTAQKGQIRAATETMVELQRLRSQIERDGNRLDKALAVLDQVNRLQAELVGRSPEMEQAVRTVDASIALQSKVAELSRNLPAQAAGIAEAQDVLTQLASLKTQALNEQANLVVAREQMDVMSVIVKGLVTAGDRMMQAARPPANCWPSRTC